MNNQRVRYGNGAPPSECGPLPLIRNGILRRVEIVPAVDENIANENDRARPASGVIPDSAPLAAIGALSDMLDSANQIVEAMNRAGLSAANRPKSTLWVQVAECENKAADLLHRLARLRRAVFR